MLKQLKGLFEDADFTTALALTIAVAVLMIGVYQLARFLLNKREKKKVTSSVSRGIVLWIVGIGGFLTVVLSSPIENSIKIEVLKILGVILSAAFALSSTTFLGNAFAGLMLKVTKNFQPGDFIKVNDLKGRVSEIGIFRVEVVTDKMDIMTIPNLYLVSNPVTISTFAKNPKRKDDKEGKIIYSVVSLGYDVPRDRVETALLKAAKDVGLEDSFVFITELGDFSVVYKVHGLLKDKDKVMVMPSLLNGSVLDQLHKAQIEIVSPNFMNQRQIGPEPMIARAKRPTVLLESFNPQDIIFSRAIQAESIEIKKKRYESAQLRIVDLKEAMNTLEDELQIKHTESRISSLESFCEKLQEAIKTESADMKKE